MIYVFSVEVVLPRRATTFLRKVYLRGSALNWAAAGLVDTTLR